MPGRVLAVRCTGVGRGLTRAYAGEVSRSSQTFRHCAAPVTNAWFERFNLTRSLISFFCFRPLQDAKFVIESRDVHRNKTTSGCKPFVVSVRGAVTPQVHCIKGDNGEYHYSYRTAKVKTTSTLCISTRIWAARNTHCCLDTITLWLKFSRILHTLFGRGV